MRYNEESNQQSTYLRATRGGPVSVMTRWAPIGNDHPHQTGAVSRRRATPTAKDPPSLAATCTAAPPNARRRLCGDQAQDGIPTLADNHCSQCQQADMAVPSAHPLDTRRLFCSRNLAFRNS